MINETSERTFVFLDHTEFTLKKSLKQKGLNQHFKRDLIP